MSDTLAVVLAAGRRLALDAGAFVAALEYATGREATLAGKPSTMFFQAAAESMGVELFNLAVVGDDPGTDVAGAHACDAAAILVKTGRFREAALTPSSRPDLILDSVATLPAASPLSPGHHYVVCIRLPGESPCRFRRWWRGR